MASIKYETLADTRKLLEDIEGSFVEAERVTDDLSNIKQNVSFDDTRANLDNEKDNLLVEKQKVIDKKTEVDNEILTLEARVEEIPSLIEQKEEEIQTILDNSNPYYLRVSGDEFYVRSLREDIKELNDEKDDATRKISNLSIVSDAYQNAQGAFDSFDSTIDDVKSGINNIESAIDGVNNKVDDFVGGIRGQLGGALDGLGELEGKFDDFTNSIGGGCGIPDLLKDLLIEKLKTLAKKFAAQKSLLVTRQLAAFGTPTGPLGDIAAVAGQVNSIRADVQAKIDQVKGYIATAESFKDGFQALLNGDLDPAAILAFADKWGGDVPGLGGYIDQANDLYSQLKNFDVCALLPNIVKGADGAVFTEPNEAVATTKDPEPVKPLEPTVEDKRVLPAETIQERFTGTNVQIEIPDQKTLEEQYETFRNNWNFVLKPYYSSLQKAENNIVELQNATEITLLRQLSVSTGHTLDYLVQNGKVDALTTRLYFQLKFVIRLKNARSEFIMKVNELKNIHTMNLTRREGVSGKAEAIALANKSVDDFIDSSDFTQIVLNLSDQDKVNYSSLVRIYSDEYNFYSSPNALREEARSIVNGCLKPLSSQLYDYWNYSDTR